MGSTSESDQIERATNHIKKLQSNLEKLKQKKKCLIEEAAAKRSDSNGSAIANIPKMEIHVKGRAIEVVLRTDLNGQFMFNEIIRMVHEEGAEVVNATYSVTDDAVFHNIHFEIGEEQEAARITARLRKFVQHG